jgi:hypothetical protein
MWKYVMGLVQKTTEKTSEEKFKNPVKLDTRELDFILEKLQTAQYIGHEFEMFYNVWVKLNNMKK